VLTLAIIESSILPIIDRLVSDPIPNIRFNVAKSYSSLINVLRQVPESGTLEAAQHAAAGTKPSLTASLKPLSTLDKDKDTPAPPKMPTLPGCAKGHALIVDRVLPNLEKLEHDDDVDVCYFATTAARSANPDFDKDDDAMQA
jgi:serine/threonine-protein phosphatase 2A regulatory subunit A